MANRTPGGGTRIAVGSILVVFGILLIMSNFGILEDIPFRDYWPMILVILGLLRMVRAPGRPGPPDGYWLLVIGLWLQWSVLRLYGLGFGDTWPALIVAWGISILWESLERKTPPITHEEKSHE